MFETINTWIESLNVRAMLDQYEYLVCVGSLENDTLCLEKIVYCLRWKRCNRHVKEKLIITAKMEIVTDDLSQEN